MPIDSEVPIIPPEETLPDTWYLDQDEVDNFIARLNQGEFNYATLETICEELDYKLNILNIKTKAQRNGQEESVVLELTETIEKLKPYRKKMRQAQQRDGADLIEIEIGDGHIH